MMSLVTFCGLHATFSKDILIPILYGYSHINDTCTEVADNAITAIRHMFSMSFSACEQS